MEGAEAGDLLGWGEGRGDGEDGAELVELGGVEVGGIGVGLDADSVAVEEDALDEALGGGQVGVVVEMEEGRVCAGGVAADCDVVGVTAEMINVGCCPF